MDEMAAMLAEEPKDVQMNMMENKEGDSADRDDEEVDCKCCYCKCCHCSRQPIKCCCCDVTMYCLLCTFIPIGIILLILILILI